MSSPPGNLHPTPFFASSLRWRHFEFERALKSAHPALVSFLHAFQVQILDRSMLPEQGLSEIEGGVHHFLKGGGRHGRGVYVVYCETRKTRKHVL